jgi:hypothetical protein
MNFGIGISEVLAEVNRPHSVFSLEYQKTDGEWGSKERCKLRSSGNNQLNERKKMNRSGTLRLFNLEKGGDFDIYIDFLRVFNGQKINHFQ